jgi:hypothetical protein
MGLFDYFAALRETISLRKRLRGIAFEKVRMSSS